MREDLLELLQATSRLEGYVIAKSGLERPKQVGDDLELITSIVLKLIDKAAK